MSSIHQILNPLPPFLREKKLVFLRNAALLLDRDLHDDGFFADAADLLSGREEALRVYRLAVQERYRFFSFGDAMFIE